MAFVKLDCGILDSTTWHDKPVRDVFITALLMARPRLTKEPIPQLKADKDGGIEETGFSVPEGEYGFVAAAAPALIVRAGLSIEEGTGALSRLGAPDPDSRSPEYGGRRLVRVAGGFIVLNFRRYHDKDHTSAERQRRFQERKKAGANGVDNAANAVTTPDITQDRGQRTEEKREGAPLSQASPVTVGPTLEEWCARGTKEHPGWSERDMKRSFLIAEEGGWPKNWHRRQDVLHGRYVERAEDKVATPSPADREKASTLRTIRKAKESTSPPRQPEPLA